MLRLFKCHDESNSILAQSRLEVRTQSDKLKWILLHHMPTFIWSDGRPLAEVRKILTDMTYFTCRGVSYLQVSFLGFND